MKKIILSIALLGIVGCTNLQEKSSTADANHEQEEEEAWNQWLNEEDDADMPMDMGSDTCCAHWVGTSCVHELIPGCAGGADKFEENFSDSSGINQ